MTSLPGRLYPVLLLAASLSLTACVSDPLQIPEPRHPTAFADDDVFPAASRPAGLIEGFDAQDDDEGPWRTGDRILLGLRFSDGTKSETFWMTLEVVGLGATPETEGTASVLVRLFEADGREAGTAIRIVRPEALAANPWPRFTGLAGAARRGDGLDALAAAAEAEFGPGTEGDAAWLRWSKAVRGAGAPRFVRRRLKATALEAALGSVSVLDLGLSVLSPPTVLVDVKRLPGTASLPCRFADLRIAPPVVAPHAFLLGGSTRCRFDVTLTRAAPPHAILGGVLEIAGRHETDPGRTFLVRVLAARRGVPEPPEADGAPDARSPAPAPRTTP